MKAVLKNVLFFSFPALVLVLFGLSGCGGGGSSSSTTTASTTSGTVSGSYYEGATVCFDTDSDGSCSGEATATTSGSDGSFTLDGSGGYNIIAEIKPGAKKHDVVGDAGVDINASTQTVFAIPAEAIATAKLQGGKVVISAVSTKLFTYVKTHPNDDITTAMSVVANALGLDKDSLLKDFNDPNVPETTRLEIKAKADALLEDIKGKSSISDVESAVTNFVASIKLPERIDVIKSSQ